MEKRSRMTRREQLEWLQRKKGSSYLQGFEFMTDQEVSDHYAEVYPLYCKLPDGKEFPSSSSTCPECGKPRSPVPGKKPPVPIDLREFAREQWI
jgi:hypothetical protein